MVEALRLISLLFIAHSFLMVLYRRNKSTFDPLLSICFWQKLGTFKSLAVEWYFFPMTSLVNHYFPLMILFSMIRFRKLDLHSIQQVQYWYRQNQNRQQISLSSLLWTGTSLDLTSKIPLWTKKKVLNRLKR